jgi:hypothetical protein
VVTLVPFLVLRNLKFSLTTPLSYFCNRIRLTADVRIIGGGGPVLAGAVASLDEDWVLAESVSMLRVRSGAKKLRMETSVEGVSAAAGTVVGTGFFEIGAVSSVLCRLHFWTSLERPSWVAADFGFLD